jgi:hypothetical protein
LVHMLCVDMEICARYCLISSETNFIRLHKGLHVINYFITDLKRVYEPTDTQDVIINWKVTCRSTCDTWDIHDDCTQ